MKNEDPSRRNFLGKLALGTSVATLGALPACLEASSPVDPALVGDSDDWFKAGMKGTHRIVYDAPEPHKAYPIIWTWAYYLTNNQTGTEDNDMTGVCVLRHNAIPFAMQDDLWAKYKFGETFGITDNTTEAPAVRNPYYIPGEGDYPMPGIDGIKALQDRGAMFCVCDLALTVYSGFIAKGMDLDPDEVKAEWVAGVHPGIQIVPSGVWALGRAQEHGAGYIYAGG
jgi:intracellular sulfur oxidation DsrE/DsrF family protein